MQKKRWFVTGVVASTSTYWKDLGSERRRMTGTRLLLKTHSLGRVQKTKASEEMRVSWSAKKLDGGMKWIVHFRGSNGEFRIKELIVLDWWKIRFMWPNKSIRVLGRWKKFNELICFWLMVCHYMLISIRASWPTERMVPLYTFSWKL